MSAELERLCYQIACNQRDIIAALKRAYPRGTWWMVRILHQQKKLTRMKVSDYEGGRSAIVRFVVEMNPGEYGQNKGRWFRRDVPASNIIERA